MRRILRSIGIGFLGLGLALCLGMGLGAAAPASAATLTLTYDIDGGTWGSGVNALNVKNGSLQVTFQAGNNGTKLTGPATLHSFSMVASKFFGVGNAQVIRRMEATLLSSVMGVRTSLHVGTITDDFFIPGSPGTPGQAYPGEFNFDYRLFAFCNGPSATACANAMTANGGTGYPYKASLDFYNGTYVTGGATFPLFRFLATSGGGLQGKLGFGTFVGQEVARQFVPEPGTAMMLLPGFAGLVGLAALGRRRNSAGPRGR